jgi:hypothetical protein
VGAFGQCRCQKLSSSFIESLRERRPGECKSHIVAPSLVKAIPRSSVGVSMVGMLLGLESSSEAGGWLDAGKENWALRLPEA